MQEVTKGQLCEHESDDRIHDAEKDRMGWDRPEVRDALAKGIGEIRKPDLPDHR